jgi:oligopeptidase B
MNAEKSNWKAFLDTTKAERQRFEKRLHERSVGPDETPPERMSGYYYFSAEDPFFECYRKKSVSDPSEPQRVFSLRDVPELAKADDMKLRSLETPNIRISDDDTKVLYTLDVTGDEMKILGFKDIKSGAIKRLAIGITAEWSKDGRKIFYTIPDQNARPFKVASIDIYTGESEILWEEKDPAFFVDLTMTKDKKYIVLNSNSKTTSEVCVIDRVDGAIRQIVPRIKDVRYFLEHS